MNNLISDDLVLFHGWASSPLVWHPMLQGMTLKGRCVSFGSTSTVEDIRTTAIHATSLAPSWVAGWSMGAMLAVEAAIAHPANIKGLLLVSGTLRFAHVKRQRGWPDRVLQRMQQRMDTEPAEVLREFDELMFAPGEETFLRSWRQAMNPLHGCSLSGLKAGLEYLRQTDLSKEIENLNCPVVWVHGEADRVTPIGALQDLPGTHRCVVVPAAGHALPWTHAQHLQRELADLQKGVHQSK